MGAGSEDLFGDAAAIEPAVPGSYGQAPAGFRLPEAMRLGPVRLQVADLERSLTCYRDVLGLRVLDHADGRARLGSHGDLRPLVDLMERRGARRAAPRHGLYHFATLLPTRADLGRFVRHLGEAGVRAGAADHLVSEAFYLTDPDGLGIEVYADRPREAWTRVGRELRMATDPVDVRGLMQAAGDVRWDGMPSGTVIGHVHLHVGDTARAGAFYGDRMGFDRMVWRYPGALFLAAGGYHHHLGANTWAGPTATAPAPDEAQLLAWTMELPAAADVASLAASLGAGGVAVRPIGDAAFEVRDPWGTAVVVRQVPS
ncbi:glyoxalase [Luteitalea sp. TBR-22]|uniref:VOC family protein n=1 Tax=Luteitalea sp. TBR-22 TaxID=2802971 RepID=UPI001AFC215A|nr:VOC family protein [Luteitalea sp. TBR-22]BCS32091.1 glyoxalase [Luteitalea sp. TBR-22]